MNQLQQYINTLEIPHRGDCPYCHNKNTFVANLVDGQILYYCYHANCKLKGRLNHELGLSDIKNLRYITDLTAGLLYRGNNSTIISSSQKIFIVPNHWQNPLQNKRCYNFLKYWNILDVYIDRLVDIYYDPKLERCVFIIKDLNKEIKGAVGRALRMDNPPRWYVYSRLDHCPGFIISGTKESILLVEDFVSASYASAITNTCALLGTSLPHAAISYFKAFNRIFIALDKDATNKSLKLQHQLAPYVKSYVISLEIDIKYFKKEQLEELKRDVSSYL